MMLTVEDRKQICASVPLIERYGEFITGSMYRRLFQEYPEIQLFFNLNHQRSSLQARALAEALLFFAKDADRIKEDSPKLQPIIHKHVALGVLPEHYPMVGACLLGAMKEVLGEQLSESALSAWERGYFHLAELLISAEEKLYQYYASQPGGWRGFRKFRVEKKIAESKAITSFYLKPINGGILMSYLPGQYTTIKIRLPTGMEVMRHYTLSDAPGKDYYRITVKAERAPENHPTAPDGLVSSHLHKMVLPGDTIDLRPPNGDFFLAESNMPLVLLSAGVGITPMMSIANALVFRRQKRDLYFIHVTRNHTTHAMSQELQVLSQFNSALRLYTCYSRPLADHKYACDYTGRPTAQWLAKILPGVECDVYFCGPIPFMEFVYYALRAWGISSERLHFEYFGPTGSLKFCSNAFKAKASL